jgi:transposase-like protein
MIDSKKKVDMEYCKGCGGKDLVKNGRSPEGAQKYKCKSCSRTYRAGDNRLKHSMERRIRVMKMYLEGIGIRTIERLENVSAALIVYWIRHFGELIRKELRRQVIPDKPQEIEILELDELFTYYQKKVKKPMYGLLWIGSETKLLISK